MIELTAKSSSGGTYQVTFAMEGERVSARCTCKAGIMGNLCKHRIALLAGDARILANPEQVTDMQRVAEWAKQARMMEHTITAPAAGTVKAFCYAAGEQVGDGAALVEFEGNG
jgi:uncharacterized Zn finger protein